VPDLYALAGDDAFSCHDTPRPSATSKRSTRPLAGCAAVF
jgi:hypothetical protein